MMIKTNIYDIRNLLLTIAFVMSVVGCGYDGLVGTQGAVDTPEMMSGEISLTLNLSLNDNGSATRAGEDDQEVTRPGVDQSGIDENKIHTIYLFFEKLKDDDTSADNGKKKYIRFTNWQGAVNQIKVPIDASQLQVGPNRIYVGVNLTEEQAKHFATGDNPPYTIPTAYQNLNYGLSEVYAPGGGIGLNTGYPGIYTRKDIAMFCTEGQKLVFAKGTMEYSCDVPFVLKRNVAKVLTTCKVADDPVVHGEQGVKYCILQGDLCYPGDYTDADLRGQDRGWIRQSDVRFLVNALNLKSFIMEKSEWDFDKQKWKYMDPNYEGLDQYFTINSSGVPIPQLKGEFLYNAVQMLNQQSAYYAGTLVHDENRLPEAGKDNSGSYYAGLYCPENTFTTDQVSDANLLILEEYDYPWPMITHVSITAKFTPRELYVEKEMADWIMNEEDDNVPSEMRRKIKQKVENGREFLTVEGGRTIVIINTDSEKESQAILTASLRRHYAVQESGIYDHQKKGFPANTYLSVVDEQGYTEFYTYGAARIIAEAAGWKEDPDDEDNYKQLASFKAMPRGRGYYYTYIDNRKESERNKPVTYADSQVERNMYYILTINSFSSPGRTGSEPEYVKVHTHIKDWKSGGNASVELN